MDAASDNQATENSPGLSLALPRWLAPLLVSLALSACSTVTDVWDGTTDAVGSVFSSDDDEFADESTAGFPDLAAVPEGASTQGAAAERAAATEGLIADRAQAQYTEQVRRREPVAVRPLQDSAASGDQTSDGPTPPAAVPVAPVTQVETVPRNRPSLAERLGAAPPPPPPESAESAPPPPPVPQVPGRPDATTETTLYNQSITVSGGDSVGAAPQMASFPDTSVPNTSFPNAMSSYDPSAYRVSTHITTVTFPRGSSNLTAADRRALDEVINLRDQYNGVIRVVGHASSRTQDLDPLQHKLANFQISLNRANSVASALMAKGLPADRLFVGAVSDNEPLYYEVMPAGESGNQRTEIYLDY